MDRLFTPADVAGDALGGLPPRHPEALRAIASWAKSYLCAPHRELGREGVVCPWTPPSIKANTFWLALCSGGRAEIEDRLLGLRRRFFELEPRVGRDVNLKTIVAVMPDLPDASGEMVDAIHATLKPGFVDAGLMLGEFYPGCDRTGIRNPGFRPLSSPVPLMVIRDMVANDIVFLSEQREFTRAFLRKFGGPGCDQVLSLLSTSSSTMPVDRVAMLFETVDEFDPKFSFAKQKKDIITGLFLDEYLFARLGAAFVRLHEFATPVALTFVRLDSWGELNERFGRGVANFALWRLAQATLATARAEDLVVRHEEERFVILSEMDQPDAQALAGRVHAALSAVRVETSTGTLLPSRVSVGAYAAQAARDRDPIGFLREADRIALSSAATIRS